MVTVMVKEFSKLLTKDKVMEIPINQIVLSKWDIRRYPDSQEELDSLAESITKDGLINPITVTPTDNGKYQVIAGRRRFRTCKRLGIQTIPVYVKFDTEFDETDLRRITLIENIHRKGLVNMEKAHGVLAVYESAGKTLDETIKGVKSIDNWFSNNKHTTWKDFDATELSSVPSKYDSKGTNPLRYDKKFVEICKSIGLAPKYQYQLLQLCQLHPRVQECISEIDLRREYATMLTNDILLKLPGYGEPNPDFQIGLARHIQTLTVPRARTYVQQICHDIKTGYLKIKPTDTVFPIADLNKKEKIQKGDKAAKDALDFYLDIGTYCNKLMYSMSGRAITHGETMYNKDMIDNKDAHNHRLQIVKSLDSDVRQLNLLKDHYLKLAKIGIDDMLGIIEQEMMTIEKKREMMKQ